jgi:hypothetical protein
VALVVGAEVEEQLGCCFRAVLVSWCVFL